MSKEIASVPVLGQAASVFGASPLGQAMKVKTPSPPPVPEAPKPTEMPDPGDELKKKQRQKQAASMVSGGRASTILSDSLGKLGG